MSETPRLALPLLAAGQAQKHVTHNDALMRLDALVHLVVASRTQTVPPTTPGETAAYIVPDGGGTGAFASRARQLAVFEDGAWTFLEPQAGWQAWVVDEAEHHVWTGTEWRRSQPVSSLGADVWGINATADAVTRLAVAAEASLFSHAGADHRLKINKAGMAQTASLLFQNGFSGRAELGLAGDDQLRIKVSADGTGWTDAIVVDQASGLVTLPGSAWARETPQPNLLINGDWQVNQRNFAGGALAAGAFAFDRWKAHTGGATLSRSGFDLTLTSGAIQQVVEPALWGVSSFALTPLCLSVEDLSGGSLTVSIGSVSATIAAGSGRRSVALVPAVGDTGNLTVRLAPASGAVSFRRIKLESGGYATPWQSRNLAEEQRLCQRYYWRLEAGLFVDVYQVASAYLTQLIPLSTRMRATPTASYTVPSEANIYGGERLIIGTSPSVATASIRASSTGRAYAQFSDIAFSAEL